PAASWPRIALPCQPAEHSRGTERKRSRGGHPVLTVTTPSIEGKVITAHYGIVSGDAIVGANLFRDFFARVRDVVGGRAGGYERALRDAKRTAREAMAAEAGRLGANATVGVDRGYEPVREHMMMVSATGPAVPVV